MVKTFTLDQIGRQIDLLAKRLDTQKLSVNGKQQPKSLGEFVKLQKQCDKYDSQLRHLRSAYHQAVDERLKMVGNQLMVDLMMTASQDELLELQRILKKMNGVKDEHRDDDDSLSSSENDLDNDNQHQVEGDTRPDDSSLGNPPFDN